MMSRRWLSVRGVSGFAREVAQEGEPAGSFAIGAAGGDVDVFFFTGAPLFLRPFSARVSLLIRDPLYRCGSLVVNKKEKSHYEMKPAAASLVPHPSMASHRIGARPRAPARLSGSGLSVSLPKGEPETAAVIQLLFCIIQEGDGHVSSDDVIIRGYEHCPRMIRMIHVQGGMHNATSICHYKKAVLYYN